MTSWLTIAAVIAGVVVLGRVLGVRGGEAEDFEARLAPPDGGRGAWGHADRERERDGREEFEVKARGLAVPDGSDVEVWLGERGVGGFRVVSGRGRLDLDSGRGDEIPVVREGDRVTLRHQGRVLLEGTFRRD